MSLEGSVALVTEVVEASEEPLPLDWQKMARPLR